MKICKKCGAHYLDDKQFCTDCDEKLGDALSADEENQIHTELEQHIEKLYNKNDPLYVSKFDKIVGFISLFGGALSLLLTLIYLFINQDFKVALLSFVFFVISTLEALVPQITWELEKMRYSLFVNDDAEPGGFYLKSRKTAIVIFAILGALALVITLAKL